MNEISSYGGFIYQKEIGIASMYTGVGVWRGSWIRTFGKGISTIWNANSFIQVLKLGYHIHFLKQ